MSEVLVAGPFVGELGWEVISWQPMVRGIYKSKPWAKCVVYTGPGRKLLYPFAEVRTLPDVPDHESECMVWHDLGRYKDELKALIDRMTEQVKAEFEKHTLFSYTSLERLNYEYYERGLPDLLRGDGTLPFDLGSCLNPFYKTAVLCIRDRDLGGVRNWDYENWYELAEMLLEHSNVVTVGIVRRPDEWGMPDGVIDLVNQTSIDDCVNIFAGACDLAIGTTGTIHIASRCGTDHLVWGSEKTVVRCAETNWFGARHKCYSWGWDPEPEQLAEAADEFLKTGEFK